MANKPTAEAPTRVQYFRCRFAREWTGRRGGDGDNLEPAANKTRMRGQTAVQPCEATMKQIVEYVVVDGVLTDEVDVVSVCFFRGLTICLPVTGCM